jgi:hypothetical protein
MGLLDSFEKGLERAVNGAFARTFKSGLQPMEITNALRRELDTTAAMISRDRILVPNRYSVRLGATDHERMLGLGPSLVQELHQLVQRHAAAQHYSFAGPLSIELVEDRSLGEGMIRIDSQSVRGESVRWVPVLEIAGVRHPLRRGKTVIGRGSDADITIDDTGTSRKHVAVLWDGEKAELHDLGSTNGSKLNGQRVGKAPLQPDSVIEIGRTRMLFRVTAQERSGSEGRR